MSEEKVFPFRPQYMSKLSDHIVDDHYNINKYGMFSMDIIEGFLAHLSQDILIQTPVSFFEFIPQEYQDEIDLSSEKRFILTETDPFFKEYLQGRIILKTNNESFFERKRCCYQFKQCLKNTRDVHGVRLCDQIDSRVAFFAHRDLMKKGKKGYLSVLESEVKKFNQLPRNKHIPDVWIHPKIPVLHYNCPYSKLYEIVFPVYYGDQVIGCVLIGGILIGEAKINEILDSFIAKLNEEVINASGMKAILEESIDKDIQARQRKLDLILERKPKEGPQIVDGLLNGKRITEAYKDAIDLVNVHISKFEDRFAKRVELHWYKYITQEFTKIKDAFHRESQKQFIEPHKNKKTFSVKDLSVIIEETLQSIAQKFFDEGDFIRIFGLTDFNQSQLKLLAASDQGGDRRLKNIIFNTDNIPQEIIRKGQNISNKDDEHGRYLAQGFEYTRGKRTPDIRPDDIIRYYPTLSSKVTFVIWKRYNSGNNQIEQFGNLKNALLDFYTSIAATYASLWGSETDKRLEDTIRIARHESFQVISRIKGTLQTNFMDSNKLKQVIKSNTFSKKVDDILIYLRLMRFTLDKGAFLFRREDVKLAHQDLYQIFNKALNLYKNQIELKGLWLEYPDAKYLNDFKMVAGKILFEHVVNNLIDNAVKYCYRGTQIVIRVSQNSKFITLNVISYGPRIGKKDQIFELYTRDNESVEGDGIGMYLAKEIVKAHEGSIHVESTRKSKLNVPCIENYLANRLFYKRLGADTVEEIETHIRNDYSRVDALGVISPEAMHGGFRYIPLPTTFKFEYQLPIYQNTFSIKLKRLKLFQLNIGEEDGDE